MGMEIERRFLVNGDAWRSLGEAREYQQGYISVDPERIVRVRIAGDQAWLTLKAKVSDVSRHEFEYEIPKQDAQTILSSMCPMQVSKHRTRVVMGNHVWEIDEFHGENHGLILAEIELDSEDAVFDKPDWVGEEVTSDGRYTNAHLANHPYSGWEQPAD
jgi:adenylate cyclase